MTTLVTLPGLDGSPFLQGALPRSMQQLAGAQYIRHQQFIYPPQQAMGYAALAQWVLPQLPQGEDFVLLGESFGGPLALLLAGCGQGAQHIAPPAGLRGVVLAASFAQCAVPWAQRFAPLLRSSPVQALYAVPDSVWAYWLLGAWGTPSLRQAQRKALRYASPAVLQHRALQALQPPPLDLAALAVPLLDLHGLQDRLIPACTQACLATAPHYEAAHIQGPHMLLQTVPDACAPLVAHFVERCMAFKAKQGASAHL